jgi:hypothetical protein
VSLRSELYESSPRKLGRRLIVDFRSFVVRGRGLLRTRVRAYSSLAGRDLPRTHVVSRIQRNAALYDPVHPAGPVSRLVVRLRIALTVAASSARASTLSGYRSGTGPRSVKLSGTARLPSRPASQM